MREVEMIILDVLIALGYEAKIKYNKDYIQISFPTYNGGSLYMTETTKAIVRLLAEDRLMEFFYGNDQQDIYLRK